MNQTVVMKFGGTSVGSTERIQGVASRVQKHIQSTGDRVLLVVSAMGGETDRLVSLYREVSGGNQRCREMNQLLTSGEQVSAALMAAALQKCGLKSRSILAYQLPLRTKQAFGLDLIESIEVQKLEKLLDEGIVPVVAGFQGINEDGDYTTLGRGGSDTTAVALASQLGPCRCIIYTDVDGVYSALPSVCKQARRLKYLTYDEMLELAGSGAKVLQTRSVSLARKYKVPLTVAHSSIDNGGTEIVEEYSGMEDAVVSGVTFLNDQAVIRLRDLEDRPGNAAKIFGRVASEGIVVDMIGDSGRVGGKGAISMTVAQDDASRAYDILTELLNERGLGGSVEVETNVAKLSVVGEGMRNHAGVAAQMFEVLGREGINIDIITTSEIEISVAIEQKYSELAVRALHEYFIERNDT